MSATLTDAPIFLVLDCDMYSNNPKTALYTLCHFLDPKVDPNLALVQFPQCFHDINKVDTYGAEHLPEIRTIPMGMDGICGTMFIGSGGFFKRQALLGSPASIGPSDIKQAKTHCLGNKSMKSDDILAVAHRVAGCQYEENTKWGLEVRFIKWFPLISFFFWILIASPRLLLFCRWDLGMVHWWRTFIRASDCNVKDGRLFSVTQKDHRSSGIPQWRLVISYSNQKDGL